MSSNPERIDTGPEKKFSPEVEKTDEAQHERLRVERERAGERVDNTSPEKAQQEAFEKARSSIETEPATIEQDRPSPAERRSGRPSKKESDANFTAAISEVQTHMSAPSRAFSKIIHNKAVEKVSEVAGSTIARPDALLSGAVFAFIITLAVYLVAKNLGYPLSGFESIGAFALGWVIGIVYDFLKVMITGRR